MQLKNNLLFVSKWRDLNTRPTVPKTDALPLRYISILNFNINILLKNRNYK